MKLSGKAAVITGAGSGFGAELAMRFAAEGCKLTLFDLDAEASARVAAQVREAGGSAVEVAGDVADAAAAKACMATAMESHGRLDFLLNNAGIGGAMGPIERMKEEDFDQVFATNVRGVFLFAREAIPLMAAGDDDSGGGGVIVNTSSTAAFKPRPGTTAYTASKAAVAAFTRALAVELGPRKIRVNALLPVAADTPFLDKALGDAKGEAIPGMVKGIPLGRLCEVSDYASAAVFLCSAEAAFLTGVLLNLDGGWLSY
jgi:3-oxoacyl-[acyl-carrier protein] reductase